MTSDSEQIERIKGKLQEARKVDKAYKVFGAERHKYILNQPATEADVILIERSYNIQLPEEYKTFITKVGNGGSGYSNSAAGPCYGIYPLGERIDDLIYDNAEDYLSNDCVIYPKMADEYWEELNKKIDKDGCIADDEYAKELGKMFGGILPIGSQGCSYIHGVVLNGPHKGRVVNLDVDRQKPTFAFEANFLDWYERWLDEIISGELTNDGPNWFGYCKGGSEAYLLAALMNSNDSEEEDDNLNGLLNKKKLTNQTISQVEHMLNTNVERRNALIQLICKSDYERAKPYLTALAQTDLRSLFQFVYWYAKGKSEEWLPIIEENINRIDDEETFRYCTYLLKEIDADFGRLIEPFTKSNDENIRIQTFYTLGELENKRFYIESLIEGLYDSSDRVVNTILQALSDVKDNRLLDHYRRVAEKYSTEQGYVLTNLNHRLAEYGLTNQTILNEGTDSFTKSTVDKSKKRWYKLW